jgi:hypothetical protein
MLQTTLNAATYRLIDKPNPSVFSTTATNSMNSMAFASKVLAIVYWRLPQVGQAISKILEIPDVELLVPVLSFPAFPDDHPPSHPPNHPLSTLSTTLPVSIVPPSPVVVVVQPLTLLAAAAAATLGCQRRMAVGRNQGTVAIVATAVAVVVVIIVVVTTLEKRAHHCLGGRNCTRRCPLWKHTSKRTMAPGLPCLPSLT